MKKILSVLLALVIMGSTLLAVTANAASKKSSKPSYYGKYKTVTCLGDSASSGYGLKDYEQYDRLVVWETRIEQSYPALVADDCAAEKLYSYGVSGIRSTELRMLLDPDYTGDYLLKNGTMSTLSDGEITVDKIKELRPDYIKAVKKADLIILDIGFDDIWLPTIATIYSQAAEGRFDTDEFSLKEDVAEHGATMTVVNNVLSYLHAWLTKPQNWVRYWMEWDKAVLKFLFDYTVNYSAILARIYELNPDVTVIANGMYNPCEDWSILPNDDSIEHVIQPYFDFMNAYKESFTSLYSNYYYVAEEDIPLINTKSTLPLYENLTLDDSGFNPHPTAEGHRIIADLDLAMMEEINS